MNASVSNDVRAREADDFVGSRAPQTQGRKRSIRGQQRNKYDLRQRTGRNRLQSLVNRFASLQTEREAREAPIRACLCAQVPEKFETPPTIPRQEIEKEN